jgi:hypothetical protein
MPHNQVMFWYDDWKADKMERMYGAIAVQRRDKHLSAVTYKSTTS